MKPVKDMSLRELVEEVNFYSQRFPHLALVADKLYELHDLTRWIPVSERMPTQEDGGEWRRVLIRYNDGDIDSIFVGNVSQFTTGSEFWITHWQRITPPEAP
jgi:hypothetical protein